MIYKLSAEDSVHSCGLKIHQPIYEVSFARHFGFEYRPKLIVYSKPLSRTKFSKIGKILLQNEALYLKCSPLKTIYV